jgi:hypothetical protein
MDLVLDLFVLRRKAAQGLINALLSFNSDLVIKGGVLCSTRRLMDTYIHNVKEKSSC